MKDGSGGVICLKNDFRGLFSAEGVEEGDGFRVDRVRDRARGREGEDLEWRRRGMEGITFKPD